eukprot:CAMPEP_0202391636 /NCGR_PEP_ID=MMETSP1127-20130417/91940_1 /ASSEMBLY_ACC=CAM_ASM_000462 /TAXON_ID=3047 /ORGANISM="Dunaliella tertiolecta, Strain CCMP1320" /LENGTH=687 /DNA_ID=CAMNT_0048994083 /DNA_START=45 /DNA_END=2107 /DNA_ORIENTATION=-
MRVFQLQAIHQAGLPARAPETFRDASRAHLWQRRRSHGGLQLRVAAMQQDDGMQEPAPWRPRSFLSPARPNQSMKLPETHELGPLNDDKLKDWSTCTAGQFYEYDYFIEPSLVEGHWPAELQGTFICNSPALPSIFGHHVRNSADADGMVTSIAIGEDGRVFFRNRFVRTPAFVSEQMAGRRLHRGFHDRGLLSGDGSPLNSWLLNPMDMRFPSRANAGVLNWGGKLYALSERDLPFELSKQVLDTLGASNLPGDVLRGNAREISGRYKVLPDDGNGQRLVLMSTNQSMMDVLTLCATVTFIELDEAGKKVAEVQHRVPGALAVTLTEFSVTDNWYVLVAPPVAFNGQRFATSYMLGDVSFSECLDFDSTQPSKIHLVPRGLSKEATQQQTTKVSIHEEMRKPGPSVKGFNRQLQSSRAPGPSQSQSSDKHLLLPAHPPHSQTAQASRREPVVLDGPPLIMSSTINSYECDSGRLLVLDAICERDLGFWKDVSNPIIGYYGAGAKPEITRFTIDVQHPRLLGTRVLSHRSVQHAAIMPLSVSQPHLFIFSAASAVESASAGGPPQAIAKLIVPSAEHVELSAREQQQRQSCSPCEVWFPGDRCFPGPLMLLPKASNWTEGSEDHAWLLCLVHDAETAQAELVVLDASKLTAGPVAAYPPPTPCALPILGDMVERDPWAWPCPGEPEN